MDMSADADITIHESQVLFWGQEQKNNKEMLTGVITCAILHRYHAEDSRCRMA